MTLKKAIDETKGKIRKHRIDLLVKAQEAAPDKKERLKEAVAERLGTRKVCDIPADQRAPGPPGPLESGDTASSRTPGPGAAAARASDGQEETA